jgi:hypothetical protein
MDIFYISPFVLLKFSLSSFILLQTSHRSLHHSFLPKLSFHLLSSCFTHFFPFFSAAMQHLFHCLIQHLFVFYFNQQTAFSIFYAFPAARDIACDNRAAGCRCFQEDVAHAFMIAGKNDTVCFCIKWARV